MKKAFVLVVLALLLAASGCAAGAEAATKKPVPTGGDSDIALPSGMEQVKYLYVEDAENWIIPGKDEDGDIRPIDALSADTEKLRRASYVDYSTTFGEVANPREAADVAAIVVSEVYEVDPQEVATFFVCFNEVADAWIVHGAFGVFFMAIDRQSGEIIMLQHEK